MVVWAPGKWCTVSMATAQAREGGVTLWSEEARRVTRVCILALPVHHWSPWRAVPWLHGCFRNLSLVLMHWVEWRNQRQKLASRGWEGKCQHSSFPGGENLLRDHTPRSPAMRGKAEARALGSCFRVTSGLFPGVTHIPHAWGSPFLKENSPGRWKPRSGDYSPGPEGVSLGTGEAHPLTASLGTRTPHTSTWHWAAKEPEKVGGLSTSQGSVKSKRFTDERVLHTSPAGSGCELSGSERLPWSQQLSHFPTLLVVTTPHPSPGPSLKDMPCW